MGNRDEKQKTAEGFRRGHGKRPRKTGVTRPLHRSTLFRARLGPDAYQGENEILINGHFPGAMCEAMRGSLTFLCMQWIWRVINC